MAGEDEAKEALQEIVDFLHNPDKYRQIGAKMPKGALLVGPPGTGKTLLAKAVAGEANVPFFSISGSEFVEMFVGMGAAKVRDLFKQANEKAPCIVFIDEIDTIGKKRDGGGFSAATTSASRRSTSCSPRWTASTAQRAWSYWPRPTAPNRSIRRCCVPAASTGACPSSCPTFRAARRSCRVHAAKVKMDPNVDFGAIARAASGASGAELANMINEAALRAVRQGRAERHSGRSRGERRGGRGRLSEARTTILSDKERLIVSYHEIGHALVAALQTHSAPVTKITIVPRTSGALGYTMQVDEGERNLLSKDELLDQHRDVHGRPRGGGAGVQLDHDRRGERHRAGHEAGARA